MNSFQFSNIILQMVMELPDAVEPPTCDHSKGKNKPKHILIDAFREVRLLPVTNKQCQIHMLK